MRKKFDRHDQVCSSERGTNRRIPVISAVLMAIGFLTVLYLFVVYILIPVLAMLTVS